MTKINTLTTFDAQQALYNQIKAVSAVTRDGFEYKPGWHDAIVAEYLTQNTEFRVTRANVYNFRTKNFPLTVRHNPEEHMGVERAEEAEAAKNAAKPAKPAKPASAAADNDLYEDVVKLIDSVEALKRAFSRLSDRVLAIEYEMSTGKKPSPVSGAPNGQSNLALR